jgi:hypothetical protein
VKSLALAIGLQSKVILPEHQSDEGIGLFSPDK